VILADLKLSGESASLPIKLDPTILVDSNPKLGNDSFGRSADKAGSDDFGRFDGTRESGKRGNDGLADSPTKLDSTVLADSVAKRGIDGLVDSELKGESTVCR